jgi:excisionase family DNA binding protein
MRYLIFDSTVSKRVLISDKRTLFDKSKILANLTIYFLSIFRFPFPYAAEKLGVSARRVNQLIDERKLIAQKIGSQFVIKEDDLLKVKIYGKPGRPAKVKVDK